MIMTGRQSGCREKDGSGRRVQRFSYHVCYLSFITDLFSSLSLSLNTYLDLFTSGHNIAVENPSAQFRSEDFFSGHLIFY